MKLLRLTIAAAPLLTAIAAQAAPDLTTLLPEDAAIVLRVDSYASLKAKMENHPLADITENETLREFFGPIGQSFSDDDFLAEFEAQAGMTLDEAAALQDGPAVFAFSLSEVIDIMRSGGNPDDSLEPTLLFVVSVTDAEAFEALLASEAVFGDEEKIARIEESTFMDETLFTVVKVKDDEKDGAEGPPNGQNYNANYAIIDKTFILSPSKAMLEDTIARLKGEGSNFSSTVAAQRLKSDFDGAEVQAYINLERLMELLEIGIRQALAPKPGEQPNMMMPTADAVIAALDLTSMRELFLISDIEDETIRVISELSADVDRGIAQVLKAYGTSMPQPGFVPADIASIDSISFDFGTAFEVIEGIVARASPMVAAIYQGQLQQIQQTMGVNLRTDLIGSIGDSIVSYTLEMPKTAAAPDAPEGVASMLMQPFANVIAVKLDDPAAFERALQALLSMTPIGPAIQQREFMGVNLSVIPDPATGEPTVAFAINDGWFFYSNKLFAMQGAITTQSSSGSFWDSAAYKDGADRIPAGGMGVSFARLTPILRLMMFMFAGASNNVMTHGKYEGEVNLLNPQLAEELEDLPYFMISRAYKTPEGLRSEAVIYKNEE